MRMMTSVRLTEGAMTRKCGGDVDRGRSKVISGINRRFSSLMLLLQDKKKRTRGDMRSKEKKRKQSYQADFVPYHVCSSESVTEACTYMLLGLFKYFMFCILFNALLSYVLLVRTVLIQLYDLHELFFFYLSNLY